MRTLLRWLVFIVLVAAFAAMVVFVRNGPIGWTIYAVATFLAVPFLGTPPVEDDDPDAFKVALYDNGHPKGTDAKASTSIESILESTKGRKVR